MASEFVGPVNIGSEEMVTIDQLAGIIARIAGKALILRHVPGPAGVRGRNSDNRLIFEKLGWKPSRPLREGLTTTYNWIAAQLASQSVKALQSHLSGKEPNLHSGLQHRNAHADRDHRSVEHSPPVSRR